MPTTDQPLQTLAADGAEIEYTDRGGDGDAVLLVHAGVFADWFVPLAAEPALAGFRVIRVRRAGYTSGPVPAGPVSMADHAAHCGALLDALGVGRAHVVGHSSASVIALQLALDRPDLVRSLVLSEPPLIDALANPADLDLLHTAVGPAIGAAVAAAADGDVASAFESFMGAICGPDYRSGLTSTLGVNGLARAERESQFFFTDEILAVAQWHFDGTVAAAVAAPALLVQGGASPPPVHRLVARVAALLPTAEVATIDGDDHLLPLRSTPALARLIADFASGVGVRSAPEPPGAVEPATQRRRSKRRSPRRASTSSGPKSVGSNPPPSHSVYSSCSGLPESAIAIRKCW